MHKHLKIFLNVVLGLLLFVSPFFVELFDFTFDVATILTVVALFFVILIGFFIGTTTSNYLRMQTLIAELNATLMAVYETAKQISRAGAKKVANAIDAFMIASLDYQFLEYYGKDDLKDIISAMDLLKPKTDVAKNLHPYLVNEKKSLYQTHQELSLTAKPVVSGTHWFILIVLSLIIAMLLFELRDGSVLMNVLAGAVLVAIYQTLFLLSEIDRNALLAGKLVYTNPQQVFFAIGKLPYYPGGEIKKKWARPDDGDYRVGIYTDYPNSFAKKIKVIKNRKKKH